MFLFKQIQVKKLLDKNNVWCRKVSECKTILDLSKIAWCVGRVDKWGVSLNYVYSPPPDFLASLTSVCVVTMQTAGRARWWLQPCREERGFQAGTAKSLIPVSEHLKTSGMVISSFTCGRTRWTSVKPLRSTQSPAGAHPESRCS